MKHTEVMDFINELEALFPVEQWRIGDIHIWPLIRINLAFDLFYNNISKIRQNKQALSHRIENLSSRMLNMLKHYIINISNNKSEHNLINNIDVVFMVSMASYIKINNLIIEKISDPIVNELNKKNINSIVMVREFGLLRSTRNHTICIQPYMEFIKIKNRIFKYKLNSTQETITNYNDCCELVRSRNLGVRMPSLVLLRGQVAAIFDMANYFKKKLALHNIKICILECYYSMEGMALNLACRMMNIPSMDIQHGSQGDMHVAYGRWQKVPDQGYEMLPSFFWVWSDYEAAVIRRWSGKCARWHNPLIGGDLWRWQWQKGNEEFIQACYHNIIEIKGKDVDKKNALITLQFGGLADREILKPLLQAMRSSGSKWRWWVRLHPCMIGEREQIRSFLNDEKISTFELDAASDLPLLSLLGHMNIHLTHSSSTVLEAESFGLPSIVISEIGAELFPDQVSSGVATVALTAEDILIALRSLERDKSGIKALKENTNGTEEKALKFLTGIIQCATKARDASGGAP